MYNNKYKMRDLWQDIKQDLAFYAAEKSMFYYFICFFLSVKFQVICTYRILVYLDANYSSVRSFFSRIVSYFQNRSLQCYLHPKAIIGERIKLPHPTGIVIGKGVRIGNDVTIYQQVTIGSHGKKSREKNYPIINNGVILYAGVKVIGGVTIGHNAVVGANSVVLKDVPPHSVVVGVPAKIIREVHEHEFAE